MIGLKQINNKIDNKKTTIGRNGASKWTSGPFWLRQRTLGKNKPQRLQASHELIGRLGEEACLDSRGYFASCIEFNEKGDLLACVSYDYNSANRDVIVWEVFTQQEKCRVRAEFLEFITSLKFLPATNDTQIVTSSHDHAVRKTDLLYNKASLICESHVYCSKQLAVHPSEPNLIWFSSEEGYITQHDLRQIHGSTVHPLVNRPKCMAINPLRSEMLAVGFVDGYTCLFDRRALRPDRSWQSCVARFPPVYLHKTKYQKHGTKYLAFNSDGSELLASVYQDQIYLFNTYEPWEKYQSFDLSVEPLLSRGNKPELVSTCSASKLKPYSYLSKLRKQCPIKMQDGMKASCDDILSRYYGSRGPNITIDHINEVLKRDLLDETEPIFNLTSLQEENIIDPLNVLLDKVTNCPDLYRARATALRLRNWSGDCYQSLRDCCCALVLNPHDYQTIHCLASTLIKMSFGDDICRLLDFVETIIDEFSDHNELSMAKGILLEFRTQLTGRNLPPDRRNYTPASRHLSYLRSRQFFYEKDNFKNCTRLFDYSRRYTADCEADQGLSCNRVHFFGGRNEFIVAGSKFGCHIWDKKTGNIVETPSMNDEISQIMPHPEICMLATSGTRYNGSTVKLWSPRAEVSRDVED